MWNMKLDQCNSDLRRRIEEQIRSETVKAAPLVTALSVMHQITQTTDEQKLNKTEIAYLEYLQVLKPQWLGVQCIKLKLADNTTYTPDFWMLDHAGVLHAREVKGFWRDDARVKIKVAARQYPWARFTAASKTKHGWEHEEIKP